MKLVDLNPRYISLNNYNEILGITFDCPCCLNTEKATRLAIYFVKDIIGNHGEAIHVNNIAWEVINLNDFNNISVSPSVDASNEKHWHGFITKGEIL